MTAPEEEAEKPPSVAPACEASFSRDALSFLASPAFYLFVSLGLGCEMWEAKKVSGGIWKMSVMRERERIYLVGSIASDAADGRLNCTSGRVDVGLESGSVLVRHDC